MSGDYVVVVEGLSSLEDIENLDSKILLKAQQAINKAADRARTLSAKAMRSQINFPARYLDERLAVRSRAHSGNLQAVVSGRDRPTSLARFATNRSQKTGKAGVRVKVDANATVTMKRAFLIKLRNGNLGLAVRLKPGESMSRTRAAIKISKGLYLLFGPSVDQVFQSVSAEQAPATADYLEHEFLRLMDL